MTLAGIIKRKTLELGFDLVGVTDAAPINDKQVELLTRWLEAGYAGQMDYMHRNLEKRINPGKLLKDAQSIICVGLNYKTLKQNRSDAGAPVGKVASYAQYQDYHPFIESRLRRLVAFIDSVAGGHKFKICVDSPPVAERALAARSGIGFIGKNHMLINPNFGPQIFLGEIVTTLHLKTDEPIAGSCSGCNKCIESCPTGALQPHGQFDARKCISYLTIEYKGQIPADLAKKIGARLFGCDECVLACPYQKDAPIYTNKQFKFYADRAKLNLQEILDMSESDFEAKFGDSPIKRLGPERLKRNARICLANITRQNRQP
jgi:epoxyqueuosine reductase